MKLSTPPPFRLCTRSLCSSLVDICARGAALKSTEHARRKRKREEEKKTETHLQGKNGGSDGSAAEENKKETCEKRPTSSRKKEIKSSFPLSGLSRQAPSRAAYGPLRRRPPGEPRMSLQTFPAEGKVTEKKTGKTLSLPCLSSSLSFSLVPFLPFAPPYCCPPYTNACANAANIAKLAIDMNTGHERGPGQACYVFLVGCKEGRKRGG